MPVMCYICGREFGSRSIKIHIPQCIKKWDNEQMKLPKSQRRPPPTEPESFGKVVSGEIKGQALQKYNDSAFDDWNKNVLEACPNCARTFLPKSLEVHKRSCKAKSPAITSKPTEDKGPAKKKLIPRVNRPSTYTKSNEGTKSESGAASREAIISMIEKDSAFENPEKLSELMNFVIELKSK
ncbi:zinc finger protein 475 [Lepeophtheirus salmonis]|nr:zinc finger protein 474-like [Lepeophtheirus salmonis]